MDKQKTAVDLLLDKITDYEMGETLLRLIGKDEIDHIRKVEREQMVDSFDLGVSSALKKYDKAFSEIDGEKYYEDNYQK